jgi:type VI secretion system secreted protein VgrG
MPALGPITVDTPLDPGVLTFVSMNGREALGEPFHYVVDLVSEDVNIDLDTLLGQALAVHLELGDGAVRHFHGRIASVDFGENARPGADYRVVLRPWLSLLDNTSNCRIFQRKTIPEIVKEVFQDGDFSDFDDSLSGEYPKYDYVVQYRETDFNFVSRLLERAGIYYFFRHSADKHTLVLADSATAHQRSPDCAQLPYHPPDQHRDVHVEYVDHWLLTQRVTSGAVALRDFDFERPNADLSASVSAPKDHSAADSEIYDYPGGYGVRSEGETQARVRLEQQQERYGQAFAHTNARGLAVGALFALEDHPRDDQNAEYLVTWEATSLTGHNTFSGAAEGPTFSANFGVIDSSVPFRTFPKTKKPIVEGPQTAIVVGPTGQEIWTDKYGRVKVQFHWDREGERDEDSSCWIRVAQLWAGTNWGAMHIPRIGQEVIVDFLEGDPDRPIITGRVYNNANMPPYELPKHQTQSGIKSRSTKGGFAQNANEIRFEDSKGHEDLFVHAENTHTTVVKGSQSTTVGGDRTVAVTGKETYSVDKTRTTTVKGDDSYFVTEGDVLEGFGKSHSNNVKEFATYTIGKNYSLDVGEKSAQASFDKSGDVGIANKKATIALAGGGSIEIKSDDGTITIKRGSTHIEIASDKITIDASAKVEIKGGSGIEASVGGSKMELTSAGATVTATMIKLNA